MKSQTTSLLDFIEESKQLEIPIYQRAYSWGKEHCAQLWNDILRVGEDKNPERKHFIGAVIYIEKLDGSRFVIDGQQRLATAALILEALARALGENAPVRGFSAEDLRTRYLLDMSQEERPSSKLILSETDHETLTSLVLDQGLPQNKSSRIRENYGFFNTEMRLLLSDHNADRVAPFCEGLKRLMIVEISLDPKQESPQLIFESMNAKGLDLNQTDLIRNFVLLDMDPDDQTRIYKNYWRPMEEAFGQEEYYADFDNFMRYYLAYKNGKLPGKNALYETFKTYALDQYAQKQGSRVEAAEELLIDVNIYADYYCNMKFDQEKNYRLKAAFNDLQRLKADSPFPLLLKIYEDYDNSLLSAEEFEAAVRKIESFFVRINTGAASKASLGAFFTYFAPHIDEDRYIESVGENLRTPSWSNHRCPTDAEFRKKLVSGSVGKEHAVYLLRRLENYGHQNSTQLDDCHLEHIMPLINKGKSLSSAWKEELGAEWEETHEQLINNIGNLTLMKGFKFFTNHTFSQKRDMDNGYKSSLLWLNKMQGTASRWNRKAIENRARVLAQRALEVWPAP